MFRQSFTVVCFALGFATQLGCRPAAAVFETQAEGEPGPPDAPIVASLSEFGATADPRAVSDAPAPVTVAEYGPEGSIRSSGQLYVRFNQPMDTRSVDGIEVTLSPAVEMKPRWVDPFRLLIEPEGELGSARSYAVSVRGPVSSAAGESARVDLAWTIETDRPEVTVEADREYWNDDDREHWKTPFEIYVSHGARPRDLKRAVRVTALSLADSTAKPVTVPFQIKRRSRNDDDYWTVRPRKHWPADSEIRIDVAKDLVGKLGPLPSDAALTTSFETVPGLSVDLECWDDFEDGCGPSWMTLEFSSPISLAQLKRRLRVSPRPKGFGVESWSSYNDEYTSVTVRGQFEIGQRYQVRIGEDLRDTYGQPLPGGFSKTVEIVPPPPQISLHPEHGILPHRPTAKPFFGIEARYLEDARLEVLSLDDAQLARLLSTDAEHWAMPKSSKVQRQNLDPLPREGEYDWTSIAVDLEPLLGADKGAALLRVVPGAVTPGGAGRPKPKSDIALLQVTGLGAVAGLSASRSVIRVSDLETGAPVSGAYVTLHPPASHRTRHKIQKFGPSGEDGVVDLPAAGEIPERTVAVVRKGDDRFALDLGVSGRNVGREFVVGAAVTDRKLYQPGDRVRVMGWAAMSTATSASGLRALRKGVARLELRDPKGRVITNKSVRIKPFGKFWSTFRLPADGALGRYQATARLGDEEFKTRFDVREFRTPTFEVEAAADRSDVTRGEEVRVDVNANYLYGKTTPVRVAHESLSCNTTTFVPPNRTGWSAARPEDSRSYTRSPRRELPLDPPQAEAGHVDFAVATASLSAGATHSCAVDVAVQDPGFEEMGDSATYLVHPSHYLLLGPHSGSLRTGEPAEVVAEAVDRNGAPVDGGRVTVVVERVQWRARERVRTKVATCKLRLGDDGPRPCRFKPSKPGSYEITLSGTVDGADVAATRNVRVWRPYKPKRRSKTPKPPVNEHPRLSVTVPSKVEVGEDITVAMDGRQSEASGFVVGSHAGRRWLRAFELADHTAKLQLAVTDDWIPEMTVDAFVTEGWSTTPLPTIESTRRQVEIPFESRRLTVKLTVPETAAPGKTVSIGVDIDDPKGGPVDSHVTVWAVDEAVLALKPLSLPDLVRRFAHDRGPESWFTNAFGLMTVPYQQRGDPFSGLGLTGSGYGSGGGAGFGGRGKRVPQVRQAKAAVRREFDSAPIFLGDVSTGPDGRAVVRGTLPDNLTTFRVLAVASAGLPGGGPVGRFGEGEARLMVTSKLTLQPLLPRVLRPGDRARLAGLLANLSGTDGKAEVSIEIEGAPGVVELVGRDTAVAVIANGSQTIVPFAVRAKRPGKTKIRLRARLRADDGEVVEDAVEMPLAVEVERTLMHHSAVYGSTKDAAAAIEVHTPSDIAPGSASVDVSMHGSLLTGYLDSAEDLVEYPYGCVEQTSSRMVPLLALRSLDVTEALGIEDVSEFADQGIRRLESMQTGDGGFGYWPGASSSHLYATAYATWVLSQAEAAGLDVPDDMLEAARRFLRERLASAPRNSSSTYDDVRVAMALHALSEAGPLPSKATEALWERHDRLPVFAKALLLMALDESKYAEHRSTLTEELLREIDEQDSYARTRAPRLRYGRVFDSPTRTDAMVLLALLEQADGSGSGDIIEKLARGLARARDAGQLRNTQENAYALLAIASYARVRETTAPELMARAWVGPRQVTQGELIGRRAHALQGEAPLPARTTSPTRITMSRTGDGRLYYRVGMNWAPAAAPTKPTAAGLVIERALRIERAGKPVTIDATTPIEGGELVAMDVELSTGVRRGYVAVEIPLPAGLEAIDMSIGSGRAAMRLPGHRGSWVNHQELRYDRVVLFADDLVPGRHRHTVYLRATTPGKYRMPPARAESMYYPEVFGHTAATTVTVH